MLFVGVALLLSGCKKEENQYSGVSEAFSVSPDKQVFFSKGNLQYQASTNTWRFAENQWDCISNGNENISDTYDGWIDLFGWGTSGHNHGAVSYQPWNTSDDSRCYYAYGEDFYHLYDQTGLADWGCNTISNAESQTAQWRTLTKEEWEYVFYSRTTVSGIRYAKAIVNGVKGMALVPDDWDGTNFKLNNTNLYNAAFSSNVISHEKWINLLEAKGAVFLPVTGFRIGTELHNIDEYGCYWSASFRNDRSSYYVLFNDGMFYANYYGTAYFNNYQEYITCGRCLGLSVRLVCSANEIK